jgi:hypothetical protein
MTSTQFGALVRQTVPATPGEVLPGNPSVGGFQP